MKHNGFKIEVQKKGLRGQERIRIGVSLPLKYNTDVLTTKTPEPPKLKNGDLTINYETIRKLRDI